MEKKGRADSGNERDQARGSSQRTVGHPLEDDGHQGRGHHRNDENGSDRHERVFVEVPGPAEADGYKESGVGPGHEYFAVGKVDHEKNPVHQRVADGDQRIDAAAGDAVDDQRPPGGGRECPHPDGGCTPRHHPVDDGDAQCNENDAPQRQPLEAEPAG